MRLPFPIAVALKRTLAAALAALLLLVAWNMSDVQLFSHTVRVAPRGDAAVLLTCFILTVVFDMVVAIGVGVVLAALLFMKRMSELTSTRILAPQSQQDATHVVPAGVAVYEIAGPLFFGAAQRAMGAIVTAGVGARVVVLALGTVPTIDAGLVALESAIEQLRVSKKARRHHRAAAGAASRLREGQLRGGARPRLPRRHPGAGNPAREGPHLVVARERAADDGFELSHLRAKTAKRARDARPGSA